MRTICISGPDGSGKTNLVQALAATMQLPILPRLTPAAQMQIKFLKASGASLSVIGREYLKGMVRVYQDYQETDQLYLCDRGLVDLVAVMHAHHVVNGGDVLSVDLAPFPRPEAVVFLDCDTEGRHKRFLREGRAIEHFDALSLQDGFQEAFSKCLMDTYQEIGVPSDRFLRINGSYLEEAYTFSQARHFLEKIYPEKFGTMPAGRSGGRIVARAGEAKALGA